MVLVKNSPVIMILVLVAKGIGCKLSICVRLRLLMKIMSMLVVLAGKAVVLVLKAESDGPMIPVC